jgi:nucleotide-binding universal stress UspA family protein
MYRRILVPLDGSALAEHALPHAEQVLAPGGELVLFRVVAPLEPDEAIPLSAEIEFAATHGGEALTRHAHEAATRPRAAAEAYLTGVAARVGRNDIAVTARVGEGHPAERIVEAARGMDLVVMSTHGRTGLAHFLLGSTAERVVRHATVPVMVVR